MKLPAIDTNQVREADAMRVAQQFIREGSQAEARLSGRARFFSARRCPKPLLTRGLLLALCCRKLPDNHYSRRWWGFDTSSSLLGCGAMMTTAVREADD